MTAPVTGEHNAILLSILLICLRKVSLGNAEMSQALFYLPFNRARMTCMGGVDYFN